MASDQRRAALEDVGARTDARGTALFGFLDALWTKRVPEGTPPMFMLHRFLAADRELAEACRVVGREVRDPVLAFRTWQGLLPVARGAPRLAYVAAKRPPGMAALAARVGAVR